MVAPQIAPCPQCEEMREFIPQIGRAENLWDVCPNPDCPSNEKEPMMTIQELTVEAGNEAVLEAGLDPSHFAYSTEVIREPGGGIVPLRWHVMVKSALSSRSRQYIAGDGSNWESEFIRDLESGMFG